MSGLGIGIGLKLGGTRKPGPSEPPPPVTLSELLLEDGTSALLTESGNALALEA